MHARVAPRGVALLAAVLALSCGAEPAGPPVVERPVATSVRVLSGDRQTTLPGLWLPEPVVIQVIDQNGAPFVAATVTFNPSSDGETEQDRPASGLDGKVTVRWRLGASIAPQSVAVFVDGILGSILVTATVGQMESVDVLRVAGGPTDLYGWLSSGTTSFGNVFDYRGTSSQAESSAGDFRTFAGVGRNEIALFSSGTSPTLLRAPWTDGPDVLEVAFAAPLVVPLTVWIMQGSFEGTLDRIRRDIDYTESTFAQEALGIVFDLEVVDATATEDISTLMQFDCSKSAVTEQTVGHRDERLNLYYLSTVDGGTQRGVTCPIGGNFVAMAGGAGRDLLSHEIGHMLGLFHIDAWPNFGQANIMHSASSVRRFLTEGQAFRAHWGFLSVLNGTLQAYPAGLLRNCLGQFDEQSCPSINTRLFDDGGIVATASRVLSRSTLSRLERALLRRCNTGDSGDSDLGHDPSALLAVFRNGPSPGLRAVVESEAGSARLQRHVDAIREEALRLLVLNDDGRAGSALAEAIREAPEMFGGVVAWGRGRLERR